MADFKLPENDETPKPENERKELKTPTKISEITNPKLKEEVAEQKELSDSIKPIQIKAKNLAEYGEKQQKIINDLMSKFDVWSTWRQPHEDMWNRIYEMYIGLIQASKTPTRAKIFVPIVFQVVEAALPKLMNIIFGQDEFFDVIPTVKDDQPFADNIKLLLKYQLFQSNLFVKYLDFGKQLLLYGTSYFKVFWKVERRWVFTRTPVRKDVSFFGVRIGSRIVRWEEKREYKIVERRPEISVLDILDVFPEPDSLNEKTAEGVFIRSWISLEEFRELGRGKFPVYTNTEFKSLETSEHHFATSRQVRQSARGTSSQILTRKGRVELLEYWGRYDLDDDGIREEVQIIIANRKVLARARSNPFHHQKRPLIKSTLFPVPLEWYGIGLIEPIISQVHELNTLRRQRLDNINQILNRMWKVNVFADVNLDTLVSSPNGIILTDEMDAVEALEQANVTNNAYVESSTIQTEIEQVTAPKSIQGTPETGALGRTARGAQLIIGQALEKFGVASKLLEETSVKRILRMYHQLNLQFVDDDETLQDPGLYGHLFERAITPEMIRAEVEFRMKGISEIIGTEGKINQIISYMGIFGQVLSAPTVETLAKKVWELMGFNKKDIKIQALQGQGPTGQQEQAILGQVRNQPAAGGTPAVPPANKGTPGA